MAPTPAPTAPPAPRPRRRALPFVLLGIVLVLAIGGWFYWRGLDQESTDDAFLAADVYQINAKVSGRLVEVPVADNQQVDAGQVLAVIETADYQNRVDQATAAVELAKAQLHEDQLQVTLLTTTTARAVEQRQAEVDAAAARLQQQQAALAATTIEANRSKAESERYQQLTERAVSRQKLADLEATRTAAEAALQAETQRITSAQADLAAARAQLAVAEAERARVDVAKATVQRRTAELQQQEAALREAGLQLSYTRIVAPAKGRVTRKSALPGTYVQPGQTLMAVVGVEVWAIANFKETQLEAMRKGQPASVHIDAYDLDVDGTVDSIQRGSGAAFSLLPPENATGNYVKVVQRVPVKIVFAQQPDPSVYQLGPGMSVVPTVRLR